MVQNQTTGAGTCTLVSDTVIYTIRQALSLEVEPTLPSFPQPKRTGTIELKDIKGGTRFVSQTNELYYEVSLYDADNDIVVVDWTEVTMNPQNNFNKIFDYLPTGVYRISVRDAAGCEKTLDVEIGLDPQIFVPNVFTPNDDGYNDTWKIPYADEYPEMEVQIFNRWGQLVYHIKGYGDSEEARWDGNQ
ncbi:MAG: gliding motility-associated C-terminal domain-containing protein [Bacteroidetes bacterium]|nr:gliding motility-associated C-terminal domain-containing protein [Bacteroidota bacterium]